MDDSKALGIVSALANGVNPLTGEVFPSDSPYQAADIVRALYVSVRALDQNLRRRSRPRAQLPANAGKLWNDEEDRRLLAAFDAGRALAELAEDMDVRQRGSRRDWKSTVGCRLTLTARRRGGTRPQQQAVPERSPRAAM